MSTLGRKAMKKTLERLKEDAIRKEVQLNNLNQRLLDRLEKKSESGKILEPKELAIINLIQSSNDAVISLMRYVQALEDYGYELDEEWDKLLKSIEQVREGQPKAAQKKEEGKKTPYIK